jgi:hypothetical protein
MRRAFLLLAALAISVGGCASIQSPGVSGRVTTPESGAEHPTSCADCGGTLAKVGAVHDDTEKPSKNLKVWNRSICGNPFYGPDSVICTDCWLSYSELLDRWERSSALPDSFRRPLSKAIRDCPLPRAEDTKSGVVYSQWIETRRVTESVSFWCTDSVGFISQLREHARGQNLSLRVDQHGRIAKEVFVVMESKPAA